MYVPDHFAVTDADEIHALLDGVGLATLVTHGPGGLFASHLPLIRDPVAGTLRGHLARANPHRHQDGGRGEALAVFQGANAYVSPRLYPSKAEHGRVVPTWNYEVVHVHGVLHWIDDADWLLETVTRLTDRFEAGAAKPWAVDDAPEKYLAAMLRGIVGVELSGLTFTAKRKLSQNRDAADLQGVIDGLPAEGPDGAAVAARMQPKP